MALQISKRSGVNFGFKGSGFDLRNQFAKTLLELALSDDKIILITGDLGFGVLDEFSQKLPNQFINCGITEQSIISIAAAMASMGFKPYVYSIANFPTLRALEQIRNDVCYNNLDVTIVAIGAGYMYGGAGYSHHALEDLSALRVLPNIEIFTPFNSIDTARLTLETVKSTSPSYLRLGKNNSNVDSNVEYQNGKFTILSNGIHGIILFMGGISSVAIELKKLFKQIGIEFIVAACSELNNLDYEFLENNKELFFVTLEDHYDKGGFGSSILEWFSEYTGQLNKIKVFGLQRKNLDIVGDNDFLNDINGLNALAIFENLNNDESFRNYIKSL